MQFIQEKSAVLFVTILFELWRKSNFHIFEKCYNQFSLNFADSIAQKEIACSSFFYTEKKKTTTKYHITAITFHVVKFQQNMIAFIFIYFLVFIKKFVCGHKEFDWKPKIPSWALINDKKL